MHQLTGKDRLIVALDVPTADEALALVDKLPNVSFFKLGWELFVSGQLPWLIEKLGKTTDFFVDLKVPGDIGNTIHAVMNVCLRHERVRFLTLSRDVPAQSIGAARRARGARRDPQLLTVPYLSSLDAKDYPLVPDSGAHANLDDYIVARTTAALEAGCDGVIASGEAIRLLRNAYPAIPIVSPGIRPAGASANDHKRHATPRQAIEYGASHLVVGRPIRNAPNPRDAAQRIIDEITAALDAGGSSAGRTVREARPIC